MKVIKKTAISLLSTIFSFAMIFSAKASWTAGMDIINDTSQVTLPGGGMLGAGPIWILFSFFLWLLKMFMLLSVVSFVVSGILFLVSTLNPNMRERAKDGVTYSIIAIVITFSSIMILATILAILTGTAAIDLLL